MPHIRNPILIHSHRCNLATVGHDDYRAAVVVAFEILVVAVGWRCT